MASPSPELSFRMRSVRDLQFFVVSFMQDLPNDFDYNDIDVSLWATPDADRTKKEFRLQFGVNVTLMFQEREVPLANYVSETTFSVSNFDEALTFDEVKKEYHLQDHHLLTLMGMVLSTVRGILREKFASSALAGFLLPAVSSKDVAAFLGLQWPLAKDTASTTKPLS